MPYSDPTFVGLLFVDSPIRVHAVTRSLEKGARIDPATDIEIVTVEPEVVRTYQHGRLREHPKVKHLPDSIQQALAARLGIKEYHAEALWNLLETSGAQLRLVTHV